MAGAIGTNDNELLTNIITDSGDPIQGCVCLNAGDNAVLDGNLDHKVDPKSLDPNTAYYTLLDGIRLEATKVCQQRAAAQELTDDNCFALAKSRMEDVNDALPAMLGKDCVLTAGDQQKICGGEASTTGAGVEVSGTTKPATPTTGEPTPPPGTTGDPPAPATTTGA